jgi:uncharacterized protein
VKALVLLLIAASPLAAQSVPADSLKRTEARALLALTDAAGAMVRTMEMAIPAQREAMPQVPEAFWSKMIEFAKRDSPQLVEAMVPLYTSRFSLDELQALSAFYRTPLGQKLAAAMPAVSADGMKIGMEWGQRVGQEAMAAMNESAATPAPAPKRAPATTKP